MPTSLAERLRAARHDRFVGRSDERTLFCRALKSDGPLPFHLLYLHGPGGIGKTSLLGELRHLCAHGLGEGESRQEAPSNGVSAPAPVPVRYLDARDVEPTPAAFRQALDRTDASAPRQDGGRSVLMIDTFEAFQPLERWFVEEFLPDLPQHVLVVVAGRTPPPAAWRADAGVQALMRVVPLRNLAPEESRRYLARRGVPEAEREAVARFACGHPLALSLAADGFDQNPEQTFAPETTPALVKTLMERFLGEVPTPRHRRALEACALVRSLSEALLEHLLAAAESSGEAASQTGPRALFEWLRTLSFVEAGPRGLFPHDLAREVLVADLRWRRPARYDTLAQAARRFYMEHLHDAVSSTDAYEETYQRVLSDYLFLHRDNPAVAPLFARLRRQWEGRTFTAQAPREEDWPALRAMTRRHQGEASAALLDHWRGHAAAQTTVFLDKEGAPAGFSMRLALHELADEDRARDPAAEAACSYLEAHAPLREEEGATLFRYWMDRDAHQALSPVQSLISARRVRHYLSAGAPAFSFIPCAHPEDWELIFTYADMERLDGAGYEVGEDASFALFGHDWRATPPAVWLERMAEHTFTKHSPEEVSQTSPAPRLVLSREDFAEAVKDAVKNFARPRRLQKNPLTRAALTAGASGLEERAERLRALIRDAAGQLEGAPREEKYHRALYAAYLDPVGTQEEAAEAVGAAFSTFRRHLGRGIDYVTDVLWRWETKRPAGIETGGRAA